MRRSPTMSVSLWGPRPPPPPPRVPRLSRSARSPRPGPAEAQRFHGARRTSPLRSRGDGDTGGAGTPGGMGDPRLTHPADPPRRGGAYRITAQSDAALPTPRPSRPYLCAGSAHGTRGPRGAPHPGTDGQCTPRGVAAPGALRCYFWQPPKSSSRAINNESAKFVWPLLYKER